MDNYFAACATLDDVRRESRRLIQLRHPDIDGGGVAMQDINAQYLAAAKTPAVGADKPGVYAYCYETDHAPAGCDFAADLSYYGKHYFLRPLRDGLPRLHGRGITYDAQRDTYKVTCRAYDKIKTQYRIQCKLFLD